jgi:hypothetical protein
MIKDNILDMFYKGVPSVSISRLLGCSVSHVSKTLREKIRKDKIQEIDKLEQIGLIEKELFKLIEQFEISKSVKLKHKIDSLQTTYSTFTI